MKKLAKCILALSLIILSSPSFCYALNEKGIVLSVQDKMSVKPEDLPETVKSTMASGAYANWEITEAFLITKEDKTQYFEIIVKKGSEMSKINLDKDGRKVE